ncbi:hypothetical protein DIPPA_32812 [Diplonema papillatum]|nr:hypothetical protein DIPPA_32812 [Diplonema papillatum]
MKSLRKTVCRAVEGLPPLDANAAVTRDDDARGWGEEFAGASSGVVARVAATTVSFLDTCCRKRESRKRVQVARCLEQAEAELSAIGDGDATIWVSFPANKNIDVEALPQLPSWEVTLRLLRNNTQPHHPHFSVPGLDNCQVREVLLHVYRNKSVVLDDMLQGFSRKQLVEIAMGLSAFAPVLVLFLKQSVVVNCASHLDVDDLEDGLQEPVSKRPSTDNRGRKRITEKYPALVDHIRLLLSKYSAKSHARRRETELKAGCTPAELHRLLESDGFALSESCLRRLFKAPHTGRKAGSAYLNFFDVRLEGHEDTGRDHHVDDHYCRSQVRLVVEAAMFANASSEQDEVMVLSVDAKCIVPLGVVAVNKQINTKTYYRVDLDEIADGEERPRKPKVPDHSFVTGAGFKPVCVMELTPEPAELCLSKQNAKDANNRLHYPYPRNGPVRIFLRSTKYSRSNSQTNLNDTRAALLEKAAIPPVLCIISIRSTLSGRPRPTVRVQLSAD